MLRRASNIALCKRYRRLAGGKLGTGRSTLDVKIWEFAIQVHCRWRRQVGKSKNPLCPHLGPKCSKGRVRKHAIRLRTALEYSAQCITHLPVRGRMDVGMKALGKLVIGKSTVFSGRLHRNIKDLLVVQQIKLGVPIEDTFTLS